MAEKVAVIIDKVSSQPLMVVVPDYDSQLSDPSFNPPNSLQVLMPIEKHQIQTHQQLQEIIRGAVAQFKTMASSETKTSKNKVKP